MQALGATAISADGASAAGGAFQFTLTISTKEQFLLSKERLLTVMRWILEHTPKQRLWYPVLVRYIDERPIDHLASRPEGSVPVTFTLFAVPGGPPPASETAMEA